MYRHKVVVSFLPVQKIGFGGIESANHITSNGETLLVEVEIEASAVDRHCAAANLDILIAGSGLSQAIESTERGDHEEKAVGRMQLGIEALYDDPAAAGIGLIAVDQPGKGTVDLVIEHPEIGDRVLTTGKCVGSAGPQVAAAEPGSECQQNQV